MRIFSKKEEGFFGGASAKNVFVMGLVVGIAIIVLVGAILLTTTASKPMNLAGDIGKTAETAKKTTDKVDAADDTVTSYPKTDTPVVKFFVMAFCPYGQQAEAGVIPAARLLGAKANFEPHYVIYSNYQGGGPEYCLDADSKYCSMHGINEVNEDVRQMCIWRDQQDKWLSYVEKINSTCKLADIEDCWSGVAEEVGIDTEAVKTCFTNDAETLLANEVALNTQYKVSGSPQIFVNDTAYEGGRDAESFKQATCSAFNTTPEECSQNLSTEGAAASG
ncbi:MAG: hypothetical protein WCX88_02025, partial [Patescibacteria group bacterium]